MDEEGVDDVKWSSRTMLLIPDGKETLTEKEVDYRAMKAELLIHGPFLLWRNG